MKPHHLGFLLIGLVHVLTNGADAELMPTQLTCEYLSDPPVVDVQKPRLAWINVASEGERGQVQTAWQVRVASSEGKLDNPNLWDSKKVRSSSPSKWSTAEYG